MMNLVLNVYAFFYGQNIFIHIKPNKNFNNSNTWIAYKNNSEVPSPLMVFSRVCFESNKKKCS